MSIRVCYMVSDIGPCVDRMTIRMGISIHSVVCVCVL